MQPRQPLAVRSILVLASLVAANSASAYYSPRQGRWLSRDPIEEKGGLNLHAYTSNQPNGRIDMLGMFEMCDGFGAGCHEVSEGMRFNCEIYVYIDGHGCMNDGKYNGLIGKGSTGCSTGDYVTTIDVRQATDAVLSQYDAATQARSKVVLVLRTCGLGTDVVAMRQLASGHRAIKTVCGCTSSYWPTGGWGWCWRKWVCSNVNGF